MKPVLGAPQTRTLKRRTRLWMAPLILAAIALIAAACGGDDSNAALAAEVAALRVEVAQTQQLATEALLRASLPALEVARFHDIDERINNDGVVHATDPGFLARAQQVLSSDIWADALRPNVAQFRDAIADALPFVQDNDPDGAGRPILIAHANSHEFEGAVAAYFAGEDVPPPPDLGQDTDHDADHDAPIAEEHEEEEHDE